MTDQERPLTTMDQATLKIEVPEEMTLDEVARRMIAWRNAVNAQRGPGAQPIPPPTMPRFVTMGNARYDTADLLEAQVIRRALLTGEVPATSADYARLRKAGEKRAARLEKRLTIVQRDLKTSVQPMSPCQFDALASTIDSPMFKP